MDRKFVKALKSFIPAIRDAREQKKSEDDARYILRMMLDKIFGFDPIADISAEKMVKGKFVDLAVKLKGKFIYFIEVKSADSELKSKHIRQVVEYASFESDIKYALITNLSDYWLYQIDLKDKVDWSPIFKVNILDEKNFKKYADLLWLLSKKAFKAKKLDKRAKVMKSLTMKNLLITLFSKKVINSIRRELKKTAGVFVPTGAVEEALNNNFREEIINLIKEKGASPRAPRKRKIKDKPETNLAGSSACSIAGCGKPIYSKGLCLSHYQKQRREKLQSKSAEVQIAPQSPIASEPQNQT